MGPSWPHHSCCSSLCFATPQCFIIPLISLLLLLCRSSYFIAPFHVFARSCLLLLHCSFPCFSVPLVSLFLSYLITPPTSLGCCSLCLVITPCFALLLFNVLRCCPLCFVDTLALMLFHVWLLLVLCYSCYYIVVWFFTVPSHFIVLLLS
jgi:hypothetical protein